MKGIKYVLKPDEINFYFNDVLVITNSRRNPFIYGVVGENDTEKSVALYNYKIKSASEDRCEIDFFMDNLEKNKSLVLTKRRIFAIIFSTKRQTKWGRIYGNRKLY